jgi:hypothetical protein
VAGAEGHRLAAAALLIAAGGSGAVPPPPLQIGADCERPSYASDQQVCAEPALRALDQQVREAWLALAANGQAAAPSAWLEAQDAWFRRRSRCAFVERHVGCLQAAYAERAAVIAGWRLAVAPMSVGQGMRLRCTGAPWGAQWVFSRRSAGGAITITDGAGRPLAVALPEAYDQDWQPFVRFAGDVVGLRLLPLDGTSVACSTR